MANKLAGLAALAALGYGANKFFNKDKTSSTSTQEEVPITQARRMVDPLEAANNSQESQDIANEEMSKAREMRGEKILKEMRDSGSKTSASSTSAAKAKASTQTDARDREAGTSRGTRVVTPNPRDLEANMSRGRRAPVAQDDSGYTGQGGSGRGGQGGPTADEMARYVQVPNSAQTQAGLETMVGGPSLKALNAMAKSAAGVAKPVKSAAMQAYERANMADRLNPNRAVSSSAAKRVLDEADTTGGASSFGYRKGGAVKKMAKGGMTSGPMSNASRRADGIASKGKTRCKIC